MCFRDVWRPSHFPPSLPHSVPRPEQNTQSALLQPKVWRMEGSLQKPEVAGPLHGHIPLQIAAQICSQVLCRRQESRGPGSDHDIRSGHEEQGPCPHTALLLTELGTDAREAERWPGSHSQPGAESGFVHGRLMPKPGHVWMQPRKKTRGLRLAAQWICVEPGPAPGLLTLNPWCFPLPHICGQLQVSALLPTEEGGLPEHC